MDFHYWLLVPDKIQVAKLIEYSDFQSMSRNTILLFFGCSLLYLTHSKYLHKQPKTRT